MRPERGPSTRSVHAGLPEPEQGRPFLPGPTFAAPYHLRGDPSSSAFGYGREENPTWQHYERALGELEGGSALSFASGMAALSSVVLTQLRPGDAMVAPSDGYPGIRSLARDHLVPRGVETRLVPTTDGAILEALEGARLVLLESPANPSLDVCDIRRIAAAAHEHGALVVLDNTLATPLGQPALELGVDVAVVAGSKALTGHGDLVIGHVAAADALIEELHAWRSSAGGIPGPFEAWLAHRSLATLALRLERQCESALAIAELLAVSDSVQGVRYPGLPGDPAHEVAKRQMRLFGPLVAFELPDRRTAEAFLDGCGILAQATSFGGVHTTAERRARWGQGYEVPEGLIRLSAGIEDVDDLLADVERGLSAT